jgi:hypothetical protein
MATYDPKSVNMSYGGKSIKDGIADGTFVSATRTTQTMSSRHGSDGGYTIQANPDRSVTVTLTYLAGSKTNDILEKMRAPQDGFPGIHAVGTLSIEYFDGGSAIFDENAFIAGPPDVPFETAESTKTWTIICPNCDMISRGTSAPPRIGSV